MMHQHHQHQHPGTFHGSFGEPLLFSSWLLHPGEATFFAGIALVAIAISFQAVKLLRAKLGRRCSNFNCNRYILNKRHIIQTLLFMLQFVLGYSLMLAVMTFNFWVVMAVVVGLGLAYFFMGWAEYEMLPRILILGPQGRSFTNKCGQSSGKSGNQQELQPLSEESNAGSNTTTSTRLACSCDHSQI